MIVRIIFFLPEVQYQSLFQLLQDKFIINFETVWHDKHLISSINLHQAELGCYVTKYDLKLLLNT